MKTNDKDNDRRFYCFVCPGCGGTHAIKKSEQQFRGFGFAHGKYCHIATNFPYPGKMLFLSISDHDSRDQVVDIPDGTWLPPIERPSELVVEARLPAGDSVTVKVTYNR